MPSVLRDESSSLPELELPLAPKPGGLPRREEDDELDFFLGRDDTREYLGGEGVLVLRGDGDLVVKRFFRLDPTPLLAAACENENASSFSSSCRPGERPRGFSVLLRRGVFFSASSARSRQ